MVGCLPPESKRESTIGQGRLLPAGGVTSLCGLAATGLGRNRLGASHLHDRDAAC